MLHARHIGGRYHIDRAIMASLDADFVLPNVAPFLSLFDLLLASSTSRRLRHSLYSAPSSALL